MRFPPSQLSALFAFGLSTASAASHPEIGDSEQDVLQRFGDPQSSLGTHNLRVLNFDSYTIRLQNGTVVSVDPISASRQTPEQIQAKRLEIATRQYQRYSNSAHVIQLSPQARLDFWNRFHSQHPQINVSDEISLARSQWETELATKRLTQLSEPNIVQVQSDTNSKQTYRTRKNRSYTRSYFHANRHLTNKRSNKTRNDKATVVRFSPERGLSAISGVKPILSMEINALSQRKSVR